KARRQDDRTLLGIKGIGYFFENKQGGVRIVGHPLVYCNLACNIKSEKYNYWNYQKCISSLV
ncbi:MAG: hypothetical protein PHT10_06340, partial [Aminobacterium sp.]|nr:hypothetical protein [Aminobacterium sp.]